MDFQLFFGRFHPLLVHLPIGFLLLAVFFESIGLIKKDILGWKKPVLYALAIGVIASILTVITGLWLSEGSSYDALMLNRHKLLGISVLVLSILMFTAKLKAKEYNSRIAGILSIILLVGIGFTGHYGGNLTHGEGYLFEYAPKFIRRMAGIKTETSISFDQANPDSILIYRDIIRPLFDKKCIQCHGADKQSGKLSLEYHHQLFSASESGLPLVPGNYSESELFERVSISPAREKFMPPKGDPLSYAELKILKYWIQQGADSLLKFDFNSMNEELVKLLLRDFGLDYTPKPFYDRVRVDSVPSSTLSALAEAGFRAHYLSESNNLLDIKYVGRDIRESTINQLQDVHKNVTFLDLSDCGLTDELLDLLPALEYLTVLNLNTNQLSDDAVSSIIRYSNLEILNLYGTRISNDGLNQILKIPSLKRVYIWNTKVTSTFLATLDQSQIEIIEGY